MSGHGEQLLEEHRKMLMISKNISEFQTKNMNSWCQMFFDNIEKATIRWNFTRDGGSEDFFAGKVEYDLHFPDELKVNAEEFDNKVSMLITCTKFLFWKDTQVDIKRNGKKWEITTLSLPKEETLPKKS